MSCNCKNRPNIGRGASFCHDHDTIEATIHEGCYKLHETNYLKAFPNNIPTDIIEIRFKNTRRSYYQNVNNLQLKEGDIVTVEAAPGHDVGVVSLMGDMVARQMKRVGFYPHNGEYKKIYRLAKSYDIEKWQEAIELEHETMIASRQIAADMGLNMKIGDVEYQGDKIKAIFYYIADERVDFRELIKVFAERFQIRIEMKQIGARQEAGRIGGLGACGRELCCASWIANFSSVTTTAARAQDLSLNPLKLAGQCSKLKCCLTYEYDTYVDARKEFPRLREPLQAADGEYHLIKSDVLAGTMLFSSNPHSIANAVTLPVSRVKEIIALNKAGKRVDQLQRAEDIPTVVEEPTYRSEEDSITRFDSKRRSKSNNRNGRNGRKNGGNSAGDGGNSGNVGNDSGKGKNPVGNQGDGGEHRPKDNSAREQRSKNQNSGESRNNRSRNRSTQRNEQRTEQRAEQQTNQSNNDQPKTEKPRVEKPRVEKPREEKPREDRGAREEQQKTERPKSLDRPKVDQPKRERQSNESRNDQSRNDQPKGEGNNRRPQRNNRPRRERSESSNQQSSPKTEKNESK